MLAPACCHLPTFCDLPVTAGVLAILQPHGHTRLSREGMLHRHKGRCTLNTTFETAVGIRGLVCDQGTELNYLPHPSVTAKSWPPPSKELTKTMTIDSQHLTAILSSLTSDPHPQARQRGKLGECPRLWPCHHLVDNLPLWAAAWPAWKGVE